MMDDDLTWLLELGDEPQNGDEFATQGGGTAVYERGQYVWKEVPEWMTDARPGDVIPEEWDLIPLGH